MNHYKSQITDQSTEEDILEIQNQMHSVLKIQNPKEYERIEKEKTIKRLTPQYNRYPSIFKKTNDIKLDNGVIVKADRSPYPPELQFAGYGPRRGMGENIFADELKPEYAKKFKFHDSILKGDKRKSSLDVSAQMLSHARKKGDAGKLKEEHSNRFKLMKATIKADGGKIPDAGITKEEELKNIIKHYRGSVEKEEKYRDELQRKFSRSKTNKEQRSWGAKIADVDKNIKYFTEGISEAESSLLKIQSPEEYKRIEQEKNIKKLTREYNKYPSIFKNSKETELDGVKIKADRSPVPPHLQIAGYDPRRKGGEPIFSNELHYAYARDFEKQGLLYESIFKGDKIKSNVDPIIQLSKYVKSKGEVGKLKSNYITRFNLMKAEKEGKSKDHQKNLIGVIEKEGELKNIIKHYRGSIKEEENRRVELESKRSKSKTNEEMRSWGAKIADVDKNIKYFTEGISEAESSLLKIQYPEEYKRIEQEKNIQKLTPEYNKYRSIFKDSKETELDGIKIKAGKSPVPAHLQLAGYGPRRKVGSPIFSDELHYSYVRDLGKQGLLYESIFKGDNRETNRDPITQLYSHMMDNGKIETLKLKYHDQFKSMQGTLDTGIEGIDKLKIDPKYSPLVQQLEEKNYSTVAANLMHASQNNVPIMDIDPEHRKWYASMADKFKLKRIVSLSGTDTSPEYTKLLSELEKDNIIHKSIFKGKEYSYDTEGDQLQRAFEENTPIDKIKSEYLDDDQDQASNKPSTINNNIIANNTTIHSSHRAIRWGVPA